MKIIERKRDAHDDEDGADDNALHAAPEDGVRDNGQGLVDDHVRKQERHEQQVSVLADRLDLVSIQLLLPVPSEQRDVSAHIARNPCGGHLRRATNAKYIQLRLVQTHVSQRQTGKQTRQEDEYGYETRVYDEDCSLVRVVDVAAHERVHRALTGAEAVIGERVAQRGNMV